LIAFGVSPAWPRGYLPTPAQYRRAFEAFRARWPWVDVFTPWNEANFESQPTARDPRAAATFYNIVRAACAGCRVTAADVLDQDNMADWLREFRRYVDGSPRLWGLHNYHETNRPGWPARTTELLSLVPGEVWVTETGGLVRIVTAAGRVTWPYNERRAAEATARTFALARSSPRITRLYLYHWSASPGATWDSGFVGPLGQPRLALQVLRDELARLATTATRKRARARCPRGMRARTRKGTRRCVCVRASRQSAKRSRRCRRASTRRSR